MDKLISINIITTDNLLLNQTKYPILYYYNDSIDLINSLLNDIEFSSYLDNTCINTKYYSITKICYFIYNIESEVYTQEEKNIQDIIPIQNKSQIAFQYLLEIFSNLYKISMKKEFVSTDDIIINIANIYQELKKKYNQRVSIETIKKYIQGELQNTYHLNSNNVQYILSKLEDIIE